MFSNSLALFHHLPVAQWVLLLRVEESQKRSRVGRLAAGICSALHASTLDRHVTWSHHHDTNKCWLLYSVLLPDSRRWGLGGPCHFTWNNSLSQRRFESQIRSSCREQAEWQKITGCQSALWEIICQLIRGLCASAWLVLLSFDLFENGLWRLKCFVIIGNSSFFILSCKSPGASHNSTSITLTSVK